MHLPTPGQLDSILNSEGTDPCEGVEIQSRVPLGAASEGPHLRAVVFSPTDLKAHATPRPALLLFHGGGFQVGAPEGCGQLAKMLALANGIVTIAASYRLASPEKPTFPGVLDDVSHAFRWVIENAAALHIDPSGITVGGDSAGACLAMHLVVESPFVSFASAHRPVGLVAQWGPLDFVARWIDNGDKPGAEKELLGTTYDKNPTLYEQASPLSYVRPGLPPALFTYGQLDPVVHARQGRLAHEAWLKSGAYSELYIVDGIGHAVEGDNREAMISHFQIVSSFLAARCGKLSHAQGRDHRVRALQSCL